MLHSLAVITTKVATLLTTHETRKVTAVHERCEQIFTAQLTMRVALPSL